MSLTPEEPATAGYEQALSDAEECLGDIEEWEWKFPVGAMIDYARNNGLSVALRSHRASPTPTARRRGAMQ